MPSGGKNQRRNQLALLCLVCAPACGGKANTAADSDGRSGGEPGTATGGTGGDHEATGGADGSGGTGGAPSGGESGATGGAASTGGTTLVEGDCAVREPTTAQLYAAWPMPGYPGSGLPHEPSYDESEPGVLLDNVTGLMWQGLAAAGIASKTEAIDYCASLELGGYCDWRIPSQVELISLSDPTVFSEPVETFADGVEATLAWAPGSDLWEVSLSFHYWLRAASGIADNPRSIRCVRQHFEYTSGQERFLIEGEPGEEVIVQPATGLKWERVTEVSRLGLADARAYCEGLNLDGDGFRLAGAKEVFTLLDPLATEPPRIDFDMFPMSGDTLDEGGRAWTDTSNGTEWVIDLVDGGAFNYGGTITYRADSELRVFCVK